MQRDSLLGILFLANLIACYGYCANLPINCTGYGLDTAECRTCITEYISSYTGNCNYGSSSQTNKNGLPLPNIGYSAENIPLQSTTRVEIDDHYYNGKTEAVLTEEVNLQTILLRRINYFDEVAGAMGISVVLYGISWTDLRLCLDQSLLTPNSEGGYYYKSTDGDDHNISSGSNPPLPYLSPTWVWYPDIGLLNPSDPSNNTPFLSRSTAPFTITPKGLISLTNNVISLVAACSLDLRKFPFDEQICAFDIGSLNFANGNNINNINHNNNGGIFLTYQGTESQSLTSSGIQQGVQNWQILSITFQINHMQNMAVNNNQQNYLKMQITVKRYPQMYYTTVIVPNALVVLISVAGMWIADLSTRIGLSITALLTIVAILWSTQASLPLHNTISWLDIFSLLSIVMVTCVSLETVLAYYLQQQEGKRPVTTNVKTFVYLVSGFKMKICLNTLLAFMYVCMCNQW